MGDRRTDPVEPWTRHYTCFYVVINDQFEHSPKRNTYRVKCMRFPNQMVIAAERALETIVYMLIIA